MKNHLLNKSNLIKGRNADYSPKYFFVYQGRIYQKLKFEEAYKKAFVYPFIDFVVKN